MAQTKQDNRSTAFRERTENVAVIGAGPVGLAAAAHLVERGLNPIVFESGAHVAANLWGFGHVKLFSPWKYNLDQAAVRLLLSSGWKAPDEDVLPTAGEIVDQYLRPLSRLPEMAQSIRFNHQVVAVARQRADKVKTSGRDAQAFVVRAQTPQGSVEYLASAVIDASGTWHNLNPMGGNGLPALGEEDLRSRIHYGMPDILGAQSSHFANRSVLVIGSGHSALGNLLSLIQLADKHPDTHVIWAVRGDGSPDQLKRIFGGGKKDQLAARGKLGESLHHLVQTQRIRLVTGFSAQRIVAQENDRLTLASHDGQRLEDIDRIVVATGARPDWSMHRELRLSLDSLLECTAELSALIDPNEHSCGTVPAHGYRELAHPESGFYAIGAKSYGRAPNFLMATGYEQARSVVAALAQDWQAANDVQLNLPQTGVCEADFNVSNGGCCGGPVSPKTDACCVADATAKAAGESGCGCDDNTESEAATTRSCCG